MATKEVSSQGTSSVETSTLQFTNIASRISELRRGVSGASLLGIALNDLEKTSPSRAVASLWPGQDRATVGIPAPSTPSHDSRQAFLEAALNLVSL